MTLEGEKLDLDPESRRALEFDQLLEVVASYASTAAGAARVLALEPVHDLAVIEREQSGVEEARTFLSAKGKLLPAALPDPAQALDSLRVVGMRVDARALRDLASVLLAASDLRAQLSSLPPSFARLRALADRLSDLRPQVRAVVEHVGADGQIEDDASSELKRLRGALGRARDKLRQRLESFVREPGGESGIRDDYVTQRNGRFVIPVRADSPHPVRGIVHAASSSGATLFVEPIESVEANNELVHLAEQERAEVERIVDDWTRALRDRRDLVVATVGGIAEADSLQARALYAEESGACRPRLTPEEPLRLVEARHPMLDRRLVGQGERAVPLSIELTPSDQVLVLSGPNTGGKTVALKTIGLVALMAQSGIPIPAHEVRLPVYRQIRADIGDHQSLEADLSTFSAHVRAVVRFLREVKRPALFLFDEIGTGTEPKEGAAIAQAILEELHRSKKATAVATTHQGALKAWAFTTPGAASAAMEFDAETLRPTYRIQMGAAGASAGVEITAKLGMDAAIVERARSLLGAESRQAEAYMARLRELVADLEQRREEQVGLNAALESERLWQEENAALGLRNQREKATRALEEVLAEFREQARREIAAIEDKKERAKVEREQTRAEARLRSSLARAGRRVAGPVEAPEPKGPFEPRPGVKVRVRSLDREGEVVELRGTKAEIRMGTTTFTVALSDLGPATGEEAAPKAPAPRAARHDAGGDWTATPPPELHLLGKTVDEALPELDKYLDRAALAGIGEIRVIHGHGTGRLRSAVRRFLATHPHVAAHRAGEPREGGDGATVVTLR